MSLESKSGREEEKLAEKNEEMADELEAAEKTIVRRKRVMRGYETSQDMDRGTAGKGSSSGSGGSQNSNGSPEVRSPAHKKGTKNVCKLCWIPK